MRRLLLALCLVISLTATSAMAVDLPDTPSPGAPGDPTGLIASENVELLTTVPNPGVIGARFRGGLMFTTSLLGVQVYDVATDPTAPALIGHLELPHFQNEDVDLGGDILLVSNDAAESTGILYVVSIADPTAPALLSQLEMGGNPLLGGPGHTASCVLECTFALVTDSGGYRVIDLREPAAPVSLGTLPSKAAGDLGVTHDVQVDAQGLVWTVGYGGTAAYAIPDDPDAYAAMVTGTDGGPPRLGDLVTDNAELAASRYLEHAGTNDTEYNDFVHHNSHRIGDTGRVLVTEEDYTRPGCRGAGELQVWEAPVEELEDGTTQIVRGSQMTEIGDWTVELLADTAAPAAVCSAHYFDVRAGDGLIAHGWYEQGVRIIDASDPAAIRQVAFFAPQSALTWAAHWSPVEDAEDILYVLDASHGIDVLRVDAEAGDPEVTAPIRREWRTGAASTSFASPAFGRACRLLRL